MFVAGLHRGMQTSDGAPTLRWHLRHGAGLAWVDLPRGVRRETAALRAIKAEARAEQRREEVLGRGLRVLARGGKVDPRLIELMAGVHE